jgi:ribose transport system permease protein
VNRVERPHVATGSSPKVSGGAANAVGGAFRRLAGTTTGPVLVVLVFVFVGCLIAVTIDEGGTDNFLSVGNIREMLVRSVALGIVAAGQTLVILGASLDLSVGWVVGLGSILAAETMNGQDSRIVLGIVVVLLFGAGVGLVNGLVITKLRVNAFIATLGMALVLRGYVESEYAGPVGGVPEGFQDLGFESWGPIPISVVLLLAIVAGAWLLLRYSRFGNRLYAVGGDEEVAKLSGVRTHRVIITAHVLCAVAAAITGLFIASRLGAGSPTIATEGGYDLESIAAVVLGGTYLLGGRGGVLGTLAGVFILAMLDNTFNQLEVNAFAKDVARGVILIAAVAAYSIRWRRRRREEAQAAGGQTPGPEPAVEGTAVR